MEDSQLSINRAELDKKCILAVEDDRAISQMLQGIIEDLGGHHVILAANGYQALDLVRSTTPDLFLFDYHLPGISEMDLYQILHADRAYAHIPVLFLSAETPDATFAHEQLALIRKPFDIDALLLQIEDFPSPFAQIAFCEDAPSLVCMRSPAYEDHNRIWWDKHIVRMQWIAYLHHLADN
jgi:CheY-like chemotaxis protein